MKKILYVTTIDKTINAFLVPHIKYLISKGNKVDIASNIYLEFNSELLEAGVKYHNVSFMRNPLNINNFKAIKQIKEIQRKNKYDIVHVHTPVASFVTRYALRDEKIKLVYTCHGFHFYKGAPLINWIVYYNLEKLASKWTDEIVTINTEDFERAKTFKLRNNGSVNLMHGVGIVKEEYEINNFDKDSYREKLGISKDDFMILILAEINKNKNHMQIIKSLENIEDKENIKVVCAGDGPLLKKITKYVKNKSLDNTIKFIGYRKDVRELLNSCDCVALFSKREGLGKCLLEGMCLEKLILATKTRGAKELITNYKNGILVEIDDYENTAKILERIRNDKQLIEKLGRKALEKSEEYYIDNVFSEIEKFN